jgi:hypothetical protein
MADWAEFFASDRPANVVRMDVGMLRTATHTDNQSTGVGGNDFRNTEIPFASR